MVTRAINQIYRPNMLDAIVYVFKVTDLLVKITKIYEKS
jgi:hypothetical protein